MVINGKEKLLPRVISVTPKENYKLLLTFTNGEVKMYDASPLLNIPVYRNLINNFQSAHVEYGTVIWPGDVDISPDTLYLNSRPAQNLPA